MEKVEGTNFEILIPPGSAYADPDEMARVKEEIAVKGLRARIENERPGEYTVTLADDRAQRMMPPLLRSFGLGMQPA